MKAFLAFALMISCTVAANLLMKIGASVPGTPQDFLAKMLSWPILLGLAFFAAAAVVYVLILSWLPLNVAQSFAAAQFVTVILAARFILAEPIEAAQVVGIALIAVGILVIGWSR